MTSLHGFWSIENAKRRSGIDFLSFAAGSFCSWELAEIVNRNSSVDSALLTARSSDIVLAPKNRLESTAISTVSSALGLRIRRLATPLKQPQETRTDVSSMGLP